MFRISVTKSRSTVTQCMERRSRQGQLYEIIVDQSIKYVMFLTPRSFGLRTDACYVQLACAECLIPKMLPQQQYETNSFQWNSTHLTHLFEAATAWLGQQLNLPTVCVLNDREWRRRSEHLTKGSHGGGENSKSIPFAYDAHANLTLYSTILRRAELPKTSSFYLPGLNIIFTSLCFPNIPSKGARLRQKKCCIDWHSVV